MINIAVGLIIIALAFIRYYKKKIKLPSLIILLILSFIPTVNVGLLCSYILWVIVLKGDNLNRDKK